jgi:hypothetical protein
VVVNAVRGKTVEGSCRGFKVLIPENDEYEGNLSEGSQPDNWTQSSYSTCRFERKARWNFVDKIELLLSVI